MTFLHVVIPAYGDSPYLYEAIESVVNSVDINTPITVLDDASDSQKVQETTQQFFPRVEYVRNEKNIGLARNFKKAFEISKGQFTAVIGSDDLMLSGFERVVVDSSAKFPDACVIHPNVRVVDENGLQILPAVDRIKSFIRGNGGQPFVMGDVKLSRKLLIGNFMYFPATTWRTKTLLDADWNTNLQHAVDLDLLFKLISQKEKFVFSQEFGFAYRRHSQSVSSLLAQEDTRLREELAVHWGARSRFPINSSLKSRVLCQLALTVRIHALIIGMKQLASSPKKGFVHIKNAMSPIKPLA